MEVRGWQMSGVFRHHFKAFSSSQAAHFFTQHAIAQYALRPVFPNCNNCRNVTHYYTIDITHFIQHKNFTANSYTIILNRIDWEKVPGPTINVLSVGEADTMTPSSGHHERLITGEWPVVDSTWAQLVDGREAKDVGSTVHMRIQLWHATASTDADVGLSATDYAIITHIILTNRRCTVITTFRELCRSHARFLKVSNREIQRLRS